MIICVDFSDCVDSAAVYLASMHVANTLLRVDKWRQDYGFDMFAVG